MGSTLGPADIRAQRAETCDIHTGAVFGGRGIVILSLTLVPLPSPCPLWARLNPLPGS